MRGGYVQIEIGWDGVSGKGRDGVGVGKGPWMGKTNLPSQRFSRKGLFQWPMSLATTFLTSLVTRLEGRSWFGPLFLRRTGRAGPVTTDSTGHLDRSELDRATWRGGHERRAQLAGRHPHRSSERWALKLGAQIE